MSFPLLGKADFYSNSCVFENKTEFSTKLSRFSTIVHKNVENPVENMRITPDSRGITQRESGKDGSQKRLEIPWFSWLFGQALFGAGYGKLQKWKSFV